VLPFGGRHADATENLVELVPGRLEKNRLASPARRVFWSVSEDRILSTSGSVAFFALLAVFPGIAAIVSLYGLLPTQARSPNTCPFSRVFCQVEFFS
jgi:uncharacterized BrkB/YihY/UPF0761 family membrane protein